MHIPNSSGNKKAPVTYEVTGAFDIRYTRLMPDRKD